MASLRAHLFWISPQVLRRDRDTYFRITLTIVGAGLIAGGLIGFGLLLAGWPFAQVLAGWP
jgi:hypothetical protein